MAVAFSLASAARVRDGPDHIPTIDTARVAFAPDPHHFLPSKEWAEHLLPPQMASIRKRLAALRLEGSQGGNYDNLLAVALRYCPCLEFVEDGEPYVPGEVSNDKLG